ncbi:MAG: ABC transporter ATP-binding protein [Andreesenia angusta]|nr:ABC transporter ATP-binding protein [Andreesenia angusta]
MKNKIHNSFVNQKLKEYAKKESKPLAFGLILTFIRTAMEIIGPIIIGHILNNYIKLDMGRDDIKPIAILLTLYLIVYVLAGLFSNLTRIAFEKAANSIAFNAQKDVYNHIQELPISYFDSLPAGNIVSRITNDTKKLKRMFQLILAELTTSSIIVIGISIMIIIRNPIVALLLLILVPAIYYIFTDLRRKTSKYSRLVREYTGEINATINESIQNMEIIQAYNKEDFIRGEFKEINDNIFMNNLELTKLRSYGGFRAIDGLQYIGILLVIVYFGFGRITENYPVTIGSMYIIIDYVSKIFDNLKTVVLRLAELEQSYASATHVFDLLKLDTAEKLPEDIGDIKGNVKFEDVYFAYKEEDVLKGINFEVSSGESIAFVGSTGSGKSTIINLLLNFYQPREGNIYLDGKNIKDIDRSSLRKDMAVVLQDSFLFESDIRENIRLGDQRFTDEDIKKALIEVGGDSIVERGIDEKILEKGNNLSQGEKQLISFARAYIRNPKILILDEATSNIDTETEKIIQRGIDKLKEDRTTFIIAHRLSTIKDVDKILVLNRGRIIESGNHDDLMKMKGFYRNMYNEQIRNG